MTSHKSQVSTWMDARGRTVRYQPATGIPVYERFTQAERMLTNMWSLCRFLGIDPGPKPTLLQTHFLLEPPATTLEGVTELLVEVWATAHMLGIGSAVDRGVYAYTARTQSDPSPNYHVIVDETFAEEDAEQEDIFTD